MSKLLESFPFRMTQFTGGCEAAHQIKGCVKLEGGLEMCLYMV